MIRKETLAVQGNILHFLSEDEMIFIPNGVLYIENGKINKIGTAKEILPRLKSGVLIKKYTDRLILPGFIDGHVHAVQTNAIASYGKRLLEWLEMYVFPLETKFEDKDFACQNIRFFLHQLLKNGTTTAAVFPSRHPQATSILFEEANALNMRLLSGKTSMDRNAPPSLCDKTEQSYSENEQLLLAIDEKFRTNYILTPRFAITSSEKQLEALRELKNKYPNTAVQTHVSENREEVEAVKNLFPSAKSYLDVYDNYGFLGKGSLMAHAIYLEEEEWQRLAETQTSIVHCPSSNLFLGSGLFNLQKCRDYAIPLALGSDVGAGTSFSMFKIAADAYKVAALQKMEFTAKYAFYLLTLGGAKALNQEAFIGNFEIGKEADFLVLDPMATDLMKARLSEANSIEEILFVLMMLGDERTIEAVYLQGKRVLF
jgi:guanine deaminase